MSDGSTLRRVPGVRRVLVAATGGRPARHTHALAGVSDWRRRLVDRAALLRLAVAGTAGLPPAERWPWPEADVAEIEALLRRPLPALRVVGAVLPWAVGRERLLLLCHFAGDLLVVKLGADESAFRVEHRALELLASNPLPGIATPRPFGVDVLATAAGAPVAFLAVSALGLGAQRPAIDAPLRTFEGDLATRLGSLPPPDPARPGLVPIHGDLTPWNLRHTGRGLALFDWEAVGWGPPGSDLAHYRQASDEVRPWWRRRPGGTS